MAGKMFLNLRRLEPHINLHALPGTTKHEKAQISKLKVRNQAPLNSSLTALLHVKDIFKPVVLIIIGVFCFFSAGLVSSYEIRAAEIRPFFQLAKKGRINWYSGQVEARGLYNCTDLEVNNDIVQNQIFRRAKIRATHNLWEIFHDLRLSSETKVGDLIKDNQELSFKIRGILHLAKISDQGLINQERMSVNLLINLHEFSGLLLPDSFWYEAKSKNEIKKTQALKTDNATIDQLFWSSDSKYTGLIVDARRVGGKPAMCCKIYSQSERLIYGPSVVLPKIAQKKGMASYVEDLESAKKCQRIGENPLLVQAQELRGKYKSDFVILSEQANLIEKAAAVRDVFKECRVVIVLGPGDSSDLIEYSLE